MYEPLILGLGVFSHDTSMALLQGGKILFSAEQERFDRVKHSSAYPLDAIDAGLSFCGASFHDIEHIAINYSPLLALRSFASHIWHHLPQSLRMVFDPRRLKRAQQSHWLRKALLERFSGERNNITWASVPHHLAHAASAFYPSGKERSALLTSDALGEFDSVLRATGEGLSIHVIDRLMFPHSIGAVYSAVTDYLGFTMYEGEGKVMGLAGFGNPDPTRSLRKLIDLNPDGLFTVRSEYFTYPVLPWVHEDWVSRKFLRTFGPRRQRGEPLNQRFADIAAGLQEVADAVLVHLATGLARKTGHDSLCYSGGVALNGYSNTRILTDGIFSDLFIQPAANDGGTALGAALYHAHHGLKCPRQEGFSPFLGPGYSRKRCEEALTHASLPFDHSPDLPGTVARRLAEGRIVGWFQGRMEIGPRALGHRSILCDPRRLALKTRLNDRVKKREAFRPFAPMVPLERASEFFEMPARESPYMLLIVKVRPEWRSQLEAITHIDGTARVQTVDRRVDPLLVDLLESFGTLTGIPILLNTSFNGPGEPIVATPEDAVRTFQATGMDDLVLENLITRPLPLPQGTL
jgi:carbamoyltransferase